MKNTFTIDGILLLDKPAGASSNRVLQGVKHGYRAKKAGHTGTLDPFADGLLVCCFGKATKVSGLLLDADKRYRAYLTLGQATATGDTEGEVVATQAVTNLNEEQIQQVLLELTGVQQQVPPMYSALKHEGKRLYELARQGIEVERKARAVTIHELTLLSWSNKHIEFEVHCSKGTYVRTLGEDIAKGLGTVGHLKALRRLSIAHFHVDTALTPDALEQQQWPREALLPSDDALRDWSRCTMGPEHSQRFCHGQIVDADVEDGGAPGEELRVYAADGRFLGCGTKLESGLIKPKRLFASADKG
jgi:tRNA pseudouridine55 synthase